jgi:hypothetical protein
MGWSLEMDLTIERVWKLFLLVDGEIFCWIKA